MTPLRNAKQTQTVGAPNISTEMVGNLTERPDVQWINLDCIDDNPWQPRQGDDPDHIAKLAESIERDGLLQIPTARRHPTEPGRVQLAFGHSRKTAYVWLRDNRGTEWRAMPLNIRSMTDRQMADAAARENMARKDLSAIEIAGAIQRYMTDFKVTQIEAAKIYGYTAQSSVSNLLRLLELPPAIRDLVQAGKLPERIARTLVMVSRFNADAAVKIAAKLVDGNEGWADEATGLSRRQLESECLDAIDHFYRSHGKLISDAIWDREWPKKPMKPPADLGLKNAPDEIPACTGCPFLVKGRYSSEYCMRPACFHAKGVIKSQAQVEKASKALGIPLAAPGEKVRVLFAGGWNMEEKQLAQAALNSKHASLRLVPKPDNGWEKNSRKELLGEEFVALATVDIETLQEEVKDFKPKEKHTPERQRRDYEQERREMEERTDRKYMLTHAAAPHFRKSMPANDALLSLIGNSLEPDCWVDDPENYRERDWMQQQWQLADTAIRQTIIAGMLLRKLGGSNYDNDCTPALYAEAIEAQAKALGVRLPAKWSDAALHGPIPEGEERTWEVPEDFEPTRDDDNDDEPWTVEVTDETEEEEMTA
jgi:ParB/RepB/Spo0J family partition protein